MLHHHLPQFLSHVASATRHLVTYCQAAWRAMFGTLFQVQSPRDAFRVALRQAKAPPVRPGPLKVKPALLIHYHIFKNAGSSFEWALERAFGTDFRQFDSPQPGGTVSHLEIARLVKREPHLRAISSHQAMPPAPRLTDRKVLTSILIRDPMARVRSIYAFERSQRADSQGARKAKELDFAAYVKWRLQTSPRLFCNYQVKFCAGATRYSAECSEADLETAMIRLDAIDLVGTVQRYDEWLALAQSIFTQYFGIASLPIAHENRSAAQPRQSEAEIFTHLVQELGGTIADELLEKNQMDMRLHQVADALLTRKLAEHAVAVKLGATYAGLQSRAGVTLHANR